MIKIVTVISRRKESLSILLQAMKTDNKLMDMLIGYVSAHQHPFNILVHMIGIPTIMLGVLIAFSWASVEIGSVSVTLAHVTVASLFLFYLSLDGVFALVFLLAAIGLTIVAGWVAVMPFATAATIAALCFFGGYAAQFVGHAVEKSMPVLLRHPIQANIAAPFFTVVEIFKLLGLREDLFNAVQDELALRRHAEET
ncbi:MAG: DUF962 domain-containing protein [Gammaproteobacteria bacterium]|nr:DUF962 domain-containing protein [Gammaproteobacteria bacterium]